MYEIKIQPVTAPVLTWREMVSSPGYYANDNYRVMVACTNSSEKNKVLIIDNAGIIHTDCPHTNDWVKKSNSFTYSLEQNGWSIEMGDKIDNTFVVNKIDSLDYNTVVEFERTDTVLALVVYSDYGPNNRGLVNLKDGKRTWTYNGNTCGPFKVLGTLIVEKE